MKKEWMSVCSAHLNRNDSCGLCQFGYYEYSWKIKFKKFLNKISTKLYIIYINTLRKIHVK
jgi:hypothetical protein